MKSDETTEERKTKRGTRAASRTKTAYDIFEISIGRARNLIKIHKDAHGKKGKPPSYLSDTYRGSILLAIAALDAFVRSYVVARIREVLVEKENDIPGELRDKIKHFLKEDGLLDAARQDDLLERVGKAFENDFSKRSFQGTKNITECLKLIGHSDVFHEIAVAAGVNEDTLKEELDKFTERRHAIAHCGDHDMSQNPPIENTITKKDAQNCIRVVTTVAKTLNALRMDQ